MEVAKRRIGVVRGCRLYVWYAITVMDDLDIALQTVSPLQRGVTVASPTPSIPASVDTRMIAYSDTVCCPRAEII